MSHLIFLSDIHANKSALDVIWDEILQYIPDITSHEVICLGDIVGYGSDVDLVWSDLFEGIKIPLADIRLGNHEVGLARYLFSNHGHTPRFGLEALLMLGFQRAQLKRANLWDHFLACCSRDAGRDNPVGEIAHDNSALQWVYAHITPISKETLPYPQENHSLYGSPVQWVFNEDEQSLQTLIDYACENYVVEGRKTIVLIGHTHNPMCVIVPDPANPAEFYSYDVTYGEAISLNEIDAPLLIVNPGAVGQPRHGMLDDGKISAYGLILDTDPTAPSLRFLRATYDQVIAHAAAEQIMLKVVHFEHQIFEQADKEALWQELRRWFSSATLVQIKMIIYKLEGNSLNAEAFKQFFEQNLVPDDFMIDILYQYAVNGLISTLISPINQVNHAIIYRVEGFSPRK